ncbi:MAG: UDP-3-O-(3-hydroxymyristoyl)glucosamine N-acyltransferase [Alphaproteobacteria bacterium]|nr:UDP-3-O-(3-hydroxymyristoyl)glucosamine N-acyltransferase [Alphaproteobacteria bacterium]
MPDPRFFQKNRSYTARELAEEFSCDLHGGNPDNILYDVFPLQTAQTNHLSFFDNIKYRDDFTKTQAGACFINEEALPFAPEGLACLVTKSPYKAYAKAAQKFYPEAIPAASISENAYIDNAATYGKNCVIEYGAFIGPGVEIGESTWIETGAVIRDNVKIGNNCRIGAQSCVSHSLIGDHVRLYPGTKIGQDGFGFAIDPAGHIKVPQLGRVIIEDHVEIGANTTIDRGAGPDTVIGQGTWIDNLVQIGHNVKIGKGCVIVAQVGISGSTIIDDFVAIGGQAGLAGHLKIGKAAKIAAQSGVMSDIPPLAEHMGSPSFPIRQYLRQVAALNRLIKK